MQQMMKRRKLLMAEGFESLRLDGSSPEKYAPGDYKSLHNNRNWTGKTLTKTENRDVVSPKMLAKAVEIYEGLSKKKQDEDLEEQKEKIKSMVGEDGIIISTGIASGVVTEKDMERSRVEQKERDVVAARQCEEEKKLRKTERRKDTIQRQIDKIKEELEKIEDEGGDPASRSDEEVLVDRVRKDKEQLEMLKNIP